MEVEILVAEVGNEPAGDQMFHILYDGTVMDQRNIAVLGGDAEAIGSACARASRTGSTSPARCGSACASLGGPDRQIPVTELEVAALARGNGRRCFRRLDDADVSRCSPVDRRTAAVRAVSRFWRRPDLRSGHGCDRSQRRSR